MADNVEGLTFEIFEIVLATMLMISICSIIIYVADPGSLQAKATAEEVSYVASIVSNYDVQVQLKYEDTTIEKDENKIKVKYKEIEIPATKTYYGREVDLEQSQSNFYIIS